MRAVATADRPSDRGRAAVVTLLWVDCRDDSAAAEFDSLVADVFRHATKDEPGTLVFADHRVAGQPLARVFYEVYRDQEAADTHLRARALQRLLADQERLVSGFHIDSLTIQLAKGLPTGAT
jgi:quinol monooxygenase YgiN